MRSLAGQRHRLQTCVASLEKDKPQLYGASSPDLPKGENVGVFLTLQQEPLSQAVYLAGMLVTAREEVCRDVFSRSVAKQVRSADGKAQPCVWVAAKPGDAAAVRREFIELLYQVLNEVHRHNIQKKEWKEQLSLQAYVHTEQERTLLFTLLLEALQEPELAEKAMTLLFHFQGPELMQADRHPGNEVAYPVVVLLNAVSRLLALPVDVSYTLPEMLEVLGSSFPYARKDYFHFPLGHGMRAEALHAAWFRGKKDNVEEIERQARLHLFAVAALLRSLREWAGAYLVAWPPKFTLPTGAGIKDRLLSRLAFFTRYESLLRCLAIRESRAEARPTQVLLGQVIELQARNAQEMEVVGDLLVEPEADGFPAWLLVRDSEEGRRAQVEYTDYWYRNKPYGGSDSPYRAVVGVQDVTTTPQGKARIRLSYARNFKAEPERQRGQSRPARWRSGSDQGAPERGERFLLYPRFTDFTTDGMVRFLEQMDRTGGGLFLELLRQPEQAASPLPLPRKVTPLAASLLVGARFQRARNRGHVGNMPPQADELGFTPSQRDAYEAICRQRVTAVWGPPGTGKTHFLASAIIGLAAAHALASKPFRVLVTAYTHAAIENVLRKLASALSDSPALNTEARQGQILAGCDAIRRNSPGG